MKLKFKPINLEAGRPIALISKEFAEKNGIFEGGRVDVLYKRRKTIIIVNIAERLLRNSEISFSKEAVVYMKIRKGEEVDVSPSIEPKSARLILKKLNKEKLSKNDIFSIIKDIVSNALNDAEIAYFVSGVYENGMDLEETIYLTEAVAKTGRVLKWRGEVADKHSIGGIPGNRTTPIVVSICAAAGIKMPKTSSRAITSAAGTADVLETITNVNLSIEKLKEVVGKAGACFAWGGSLGLAPADDKLIRVERMLNVDPEPQLIASILAKKISVGSKCVLIDIPCGNGSKLLCDKAGLLEDKFVKIGSKFGLKVKVVLTNGEEPIGNGIGPILEMIDVLKVLERKNSPQDLEEKSILLASIILEMMGKAQKGKGKDLARKILDSKLAWEKFNEIVSAQGRKNIKLEPAKYCYDIISKKSGTILSIDNKSINLIARVLGCPNSIGSGIYLYKHSRSLVEKGEKIMTLYSDSDKKIEEGRRLVKELAPVVIE